MISVSGEPIVIRSPLIATLVPRFCAESPLATFTPEKARVEFVPYSHSSNSGGLGTESVSPVSTVTVTSYAACGTMPVYLRIS